jgi:SAM-dependent methyltransferase
MASTPCACSTPVSDPLSGTITRMELAEFVLAHLPAPPASVLEVGCGRGGLTHALAEAGHHVSGIDPAAPVGPLFRRLSLEDLDPAEGPFDAVVGARSLHHMADLDVALDRIVDLLVPGGVLILDEFAWDRLDRSTAAWYHERLRPRARSIDACIADWDAEHVGLHGFAAMQAALDARFDERLFAWTPHLHRLLGRPATDEEAGIAAGELQATGFRYVGEARGALPR